MEQAGDVRAGSWWEQILSSRLLAPVVRGGAAGQRQLMLILYAVYLPVAAVAGVLVYWKPGLFAFRVVLIGLIVARLLWRRPVSAPEWVAIAVIVPLMANLGTQLAVGARLHAVFVVNIVAIFAVMCLVFDLWLLVTAVLLALILFTGVQYHFDGFRVAVGSALIFGFSMTAVMLLVHATARSLRRSYAGLQASHGRTLQLHQQMATATDEERQRIAGALHDDTIQVMTAAAMQMDGVRRLAEAGDAGGAAAAAEEARHTLDLAVQRARELSFDLYPPVLDRLGLRAALEAYGEQVTARGRFAVAVTAPGERSPAGSERLAYRTIRELVTNAAKHAEPSCVRVDVTRRNGWLECRVSDDGCGFDDTEHEQARARNHVGLDSAAERVRMAGGTFSIESAAGEGTAVEFALPVEPTA